MAHRAAEIPKELCRRILSRNDFCRRVFRRRIAALFRSVRIGSRYSLWSALRRGRSRSGRQLVAAGCGGNACSLARSRSDRQPAAAPWRRAASPRRRPVRSAAGWPRVGIDLVRGRRAAASGGEGPQLASCRSARTVPSQAAPRVCRGNLCAVWNRSVRTGSPQPPPGGGLHPHVCRPLRSAAGWPRAESILYEDW